MSVLRLLWVLGLAFFLSSCNDNSANHPNVILLVFDEWDNEQSMSDFSNLNKIKTGGVFFDHAFTGYPEKDQFLKSLYSGMHSGHFNNNKDRLKNDFCENGHQFNTTANATDLMDKRHTDNPSIHILHLSQPASETDRQVGRLLEQFSDHALFIITAIKGKGDLLSEKSLQVPLLFYHPTRIRQNAISNQPVFTGDILPTLASFLSVPTNAVGTDAISLYPFLTQADNEDKKRFFYWTTPDRTTQILRYNQWKFINKNNTDWQLFDMLTDPEETDNVIDYHPGKVGKFREYILQSN